MKLTCRRTTNGLGKPPIAVALLSMFALSLFSMVSDTSHAADGQEAIVIKGADIAYYFDQDRKLVAIEELPDVGRKVVKSKAFANEDGLKLILKSTCQGGIAKLPAKTEMVGKAATVVYSVARPTMLIVLGVEDLPKVGSRIIDPLPPSDDEGICPCGGYPCDGTICCRKNCN